MSIELNDYEKNFLKNHENDLRKKNIKSILADISRSNRGDLGNIVPLFLEIGIDVWQYTDKVEKAMFRGSDSLETISIPEGITKIEAYAFENCKALKTVELPNTVKKIETGAFSRTDNLTSLAIPESVVSISKGCFEDCNEHIKLKTPRRGVSNKLYLPKNEIDWYKNHLVFTETK